MRVPGALFMCGPYHVLIWRVAVVEVEGGGRGRGRGKKQPHQQESDENVKLSSSEGCATSNERNACSKQRAQKPSLTKRRCEETYRKEDKEE